MKKFLLPLLAAAALLPGGCAHTGETPKYERVAYSVKVTPESDGTYLVAVKQQLDSPTNRNEITFNIPGAKAGKLHRITLEKPYGTGPRVTLHDRDGQIDIADGFGAKVKITPLEDGTLLLEGVFVTDSDPSIKLIPLNLICKPGVEKALTEMR